MTCRVCDSLLFLAALAASPCVLHAQPLVVAVQEPGPGRNAAVADPVITFGETSVSASGITPGKSAVFFAVGRQANGYDQSLIRWTYVVNADSKDGTVTLDLKRSIPTMTVWAVVDLTDGRFSIALPHGFYARQMPFTARVFRRSTAGASLDQIGFDHPVIEVLYVQPGGGAWRWSAQDGRGMDKDGPNGVTLIAIGEGAAVDGKGATARELLPGGTLIAVDWYKMQYFAAHLDAAILAGGGQ